METFIEKKKRYDLFYMNIAEQCSQLSHCERKKVGSVIVKDGNILAFGFNGTPSGFDNACEIIQPVIGNTNRLHTKPEVLHAELNAICKIAKSTQSTEDAVLYVTMSPCIECAKIIIQSGIKEVYYREEYRIKDGIELIKKANIIIEQI